MPVYLTYFQYAILVVCIILAEIGSGVMAVIFRVNVSQRNVT